MDWCKNQRDQGSVSSGLTGRSDAVTAAVAEKIVEFAKLDRRDPDAIRDVVLTIRTNRRPRRQPCYALSFHRRRRNIPPTPMGTNLDDQDDKNRPQTRG